MLVTFTEEAPDSEVLTNPYQPINGNEQEEIKLKRVEVEKSGARG